MKHLRRLLLPLLALCAAPALARGQEEGEARLFRVPSDPDAAVRADNALRFASEENWARAVEELQVLFDEHADAVLPTRFSDKVPSQFDLHTGAATWAMQLLSGLPPEARATYRERFGDAAQGAFATAREDADPRALAEVAGRFPFADAARAACVALGDLELARGDAAAALAAWERAGLLAKLQGASLGPELERRRAAAGALMARVSAEAGEALRRGGLHLPGPADGAGPVPLASADRWVNAELDFEPFNGMRRSEKYNLFPVLAGDKLLVSTSLRLYCLDVYSARILWATQPVPGWETRTGSERARLFDRIARDLCLIAPAAGSGVAVAALQIPYEDAEDHDYQGIDIMGPLPERRLFAFDLATGQPLWNHAPPPGWDGESGSYEQTMLVAGPPVVHGARVLVPSYRIRGRIDLHVACYDLLTGKRLWSTGLISGQGELNMFGRQTQEFSGAPVVVEDDAVYVLTQLGTLARLDLFTGRIVWEARYEQIPIPKNVGWEDKDRPVVWKNAPPVVTRDVVVATPHDSRLLLAADKESGSILWSYDFNNLPAGPGIEKPLYKVLIGAEDDTVYLGGTAQSSSAVGIVSALQKPGGLRFKSTTRLGQRYEPFQARWSVELQGNAETMPRPVLGSEEVLIPSMGSLLVVDRRTGQDLSLKTSAWTESDYGNLLAGNGVLVKVGNRKVAADFDWGILLDRAEAALAARPGDVDARVDHAALLLRRARAFGEERRFDEARPLVARARTSLEEVLRGAGGTRDARVAQPLYQVLSEEARLAQIDADPERALAALRDALALASSAEEVRDTLLQEEALLRSRDRDRWLATLAKLEHEAGDLPLPRERLEESAEWLAGESLYVFAPADLRGADIPVALWVLFARADAEARALDLEGALRDLHAALARYGSRPLAFGLTVADVARARIARRIELDGPGPYAPFEEVARTLFERAAAARDAGLLAEVARLYPHAAAARRAEALRLEWSLAAGDARGSAALLYPALDPGSELTRSDALLLARLAHLLAVAGNTKLEQGLLASLGASFPDEPAPGAGGKTFGELLREQQQVSPAPPPAPTFGESLTKTSARDGRFDRVASLALAAGDGESPPVQLDLFLDRRELVALASDAPGQPRWVHEFEDNPGDDALAVSDGRVLAGVRDTVVALAAGDGTLAWSWTASGEEIESLTVESGMALCLTRLEDEATGRPRQTLHALDASGGVPLWSLPTGERTDWLAPVCGDGLAVLCYPLWSQPSMALVVDLYRGRILREVDLGVAVLAESWRGAWIEDGKVLVPFFNASRDGSRLEAFDLGTGSEAWTLALEPGQELSTVAVHGGESFLVVLPVATSAVDGGEVLTVDARSGQKRRVAELKRGEDPMLPRGVRCELPAPCIFTYTARPGAPSVPVRLIPLDRSPGWVYHLQVSEEELWNSGLQSPAVSEGIVAITYSTKNRANLAKEDARLELVDRRGGFRRQALVLSPQMSKCSVRVFGLGNAVVLLGVGRLGARDISQMEVMETTQ
jgi:outer membrane protein assembly factor BamB